jgi:general secretion pathway protein G
MKRSPANPHSSALASGAYAGRVDCDRGDSLHSRLGGLSHCALPGEAPERAHLRYDLWMMRDAIDHYKDAADKNAFQIKLDSQGYPPDLETLVNGVEVQTKKVKFLRRIPVDPMTGKAEWGLRSMQDDPTSTSYGGQSVFDVYSKSTGTALDGTKYSDWSDGVGSGVSS